MLQFNTKFSLSDPNPTNVNPNTALPNSHGKVRTLKEDYEDLRSGKIKREQEMLSEDIAEVSHLPVVEPSFAAPTPLPRPIAESPRLPEQPAFLPSKEGLDEKKEGLNPFGSQSFFNGKSPFEEEKQPILPHKKAETAPKGNLRKILIIVISLLVALALLGGGYYYWFIAKKEPVPNIVQSPSVQTNSVPSPDIQPDSKKLRYLNIDIDLGKAENQEAFQNLAETFFSNAQENDLVEVKVLDKNNQPMPPNNLADSLGFSLTSNLRLNLTNDYSLFMKKENSEIYTGAAFRLSDTTGLAEEFAQQEKTLHSQLMPFFLKKALMATTVNYGSSKYKNADIRYFNFSEPPDTSLDYTVLTDKQEGYFIFATSKNTLRSVLDFMWEK